MKKTFLAFSLFIIMIFTACGNEQETVASVAQSTEAVEASQNTASENKTELSQAKETVSENTMTSDVSENAIDDFAVQESDVNTEEADDIELYPEPVIMYASQLVNIRKAPDQYSELLGSYNLNDEITVIGNSKSTKYLEISFNDEVAFVHSGFVVAEKIDLEALKLAQEEAAKAAEAQAVAQAQAAAEAQAAAQAQAAQAQAAAEAQAAQVSPAPQPVIANPAGVLFIGDSRTCQMKNASAGGNCSWICEYGQKYEWFESTAVPLADTMVGKGTKVVICMGVNDPENSSSYFSLVNQKASDWNARGAKVYFVSVNPVEEPYSFKDSDIASFNSNGPAVLSGVRWIDTASVIKQGGFTLEDGIHYDAAGNLTIFKMIISNLK